MKISHNWLKEILPHEFSTEEISERLTDVGLEVEGVHIVESIKGGLKGVVIGHILTKSQHPNADRLSLTTVDVGGQSPLSIVCGAPNVAAGQKVLVATIGTVLYDSEGKSFTIKESKVRGELSQGMICAEDELGLGESHEGIMILPVDAEIGMPASEFFQITSDEVIEIGLTPNRADANSHYGTARDLWAALHLHNGYQSPLQPIRLLDTQSLKPSDFNISIENTQSCKRYTGILLRNIQVMPSPEWLIKRLEAIGQRPVNNIVDITNYVMFELGQPLHAFDADKIVGNHIKVKNVATDTPFITLDNKEIKLSADDLMICDGNNQPLCIAGVYGGLGSGVTSETKNIFLESAWFSPTSIRRSSLRHNLRTESALHFEKGTDPNQCLDGLLRAAWLISQYGGTVDTFAPIDQYPGKVPPAKVNISLSKVREHIGKNLSHEEIRKTLNALMMKIEEIDADNWSVTVPTYKTDVTRQADIIEEIVRIYGLNNIEETGKFAFSMPEKVRNEVAEARQSGLQYLADAGYSEAMGLSIINSAQWAKVTGNNDFDGVRINNTSNVQLDLMRPDPLSTALEIVLYNQSRQQHSFKMFEYGTVYNKSNGIYIENNFISLFGIGSRWDESWLASSKENIDPFYLKTTVIHLFNRLGIMKYQEKQSDDIRFSDAIELTLGPKILAKIGYIQKTILKRAGIKGDMPFAHIYWDEVTSILNQKPITFKEFSKFPVVRRDLAVVIENHVLFDQIKSWIQKSASPYVSAIKLFDVYTDDSQLGEGKSSLSIAIYFINQEKTFDDKTIDGLMQKIMTTLQEKVNAIIRK